MLHIIIQGYVDAIYVATRLKAPPPSHPSWGHPSWGHPSWEHPSWTGRGNAPADGPAPIEARAAAFCEALIRGGEALIGRTARLLRALARPGGARSRGRPRRPQYFDGT